MKLLRLLVIGFFLLRLSACNSQGPKISRTQIPSDSLPLQEFFGNTRLSLTEKNKKLWTLKTDHIVKYRKNGSTYINPVHITYYTGSGQSLMEADSGRISAEMDTLMATGRVSIKTYDGKQVTTTQIGWYKKSDKVISDRFVKMVTAEGDLYTGTGFIANTNLTEWKILHNVKAKIHNVKNGFAD